MTVISFVVPAYNSASTLENCLNSFIDPDLLPDIEVLIINDGSTDSTAAIAAEYTDKYPSFQLINKENGGHGSVINTSAKIAKGKYLKIIDSDDCIQTKSLHTFMEKLKNAKADVVLTNFRTIDSRNGVTREYAMSGINFGQEYSFEDLWHHSKTISDVFAFHGITYRTNFYRECGIHLSEGISYEDQEYATLPFAKVRTILPLDLFLYEYNLGDPNQSVSDTKQVKNLGQMEEVLWKVIDSTPNDLNEAAAAYFFYKKQKMLLSYYVAALVKNPDKPGGRKMAKALRERIRKCRTDIHTASRKKFIICMILSYFGISGGTMVKLQKCQAYKFFTRFAH